MSRDGLVLAAELREEADTDPSTIAMILETLNPELELIDSRVIVPCKELQDICKRIRKTIVKRDHKVSAPTPILFYAKARRLPSSPFCPT